MLNIKEINNNYIASFKRAQRFNTVISDTVKTQLGKIIKKPDTTLVIDFNGIHFIDSHGFDTLIRLYDLAREYNNSLFLFNISSDVMELIHLMELQNHFEYCNLDLVQSLNLVETY